MALTQDREERDRQSRLATEAAVAAALANQTQQVQALRRPELPPFDKENIEVWIRRMENAYTRSSIVRPKDKFAFLEKLFHAKDDARINSFLWNPNPTNETWTEFLEYVRERYGRTVKQEVNSLLNGIPRDGRRPTVLRDYIKELTSRVTLDAIRKEVFLKQMPAEVRQHLADRLDELDFDETAKACDKYFDQNGRLKDSTKDSTSVSNVSSIRQPRQQQQQPQQPPQQQQQQQQQAPSPSFTAPFNSDEDESDVNAVRFRSGQRQSFNVSNRSSSRGRGSSNYNNSNNTRSNTNTNRFGTAGGSSSNSSSSNASNSNPPNNSNKVCRFHTRWGEESWRCEGSWCILKSKIAPKGQASR